MIDTRRNWICMISTKISGILKCSVFLKIGSFFSSQGPLTLNSHIVGFRENLFFKNNYNPANLSRSSESLLNVSLKYFIKICCFTWRLWGVSDSFVAKLVVALAYACLLDHCCPHTRAVFIQMCDLLRIKLAAQAGLYCFLSKPEDVHLKI